MRAESRNFAPGGLRISATRKRFTIGKWCKRAFQRYHLISVPGEFKLANDVRAEQTDHIGVNRKCEARKYLVTASSASQNMALFQNENFFSGFCQIGRADQPVVSSADNNGIKSLRRDTVTDRLGYWGHLNHHLFFLK